MTTPPLPEPCCWGYDVPDAPLPRGRGLFNADQMRSYGEACAAAERERCAKVCEGEHLGESLDDDTVADADWSYNEALRYAATAIRGQIDCLQLPKRLTS